MAILCTIGAYAQDIITLKNGNEIEARVESVNTAAVSYDYPYPEVSKTYAVGDWFDESGISGIVIYVDETGSHGLVMYPKNHHVSKGSPKETGYSLDFGSFGATSYDDGYLNHLAMKMWAEANDMEFNQFFPRASYVEQLGAGWYMPACNEVFQIVLAYNGGQIAHADKEARKRFNNTLKANGGKKLDSGTRLASSTEYSYGQYISVNMEDGSFATPRKVHGPFTVGGTVRPIHKF